MTIGCPNPNAHCEWTLSPGDLVDSCSASIAVRHLKGESAHNIFSDGQRGCRRRAGSIEHVEGIVTAEDLEILDQLARGREGLGAHPRPARLQIADANFRHELLQ